MTARTDVLARRALRLALRPDPAASGSTVARVVVVESAGQRFGLPVDALRQVVPLPKVAPLRSERAYLLGVAQVRGELLGVVDLAALLGAPADPEPRWLAVVGSDRGPFGLCLSRVHGFREIRATELAPDLVRPDRPVVAVTRDLVALLDLPRLAAAQARTGADPDHSRENR